MKNKFILQIFSAVLLIFYGASIVSATPPTIPEELAIDFQLKAFRKFKEVHFSGKVPSVIELSLDGEYLEREQFAIIDTFNNIIPYYFRKETFSNKVPVSVTANISQESAAKMIDGNTLTYAEFDLIGDSNTAPIVLRSQKPIISSSLNFLLDGHVAMPNFVEIRARTETGTQKIVVANSRVDGQTINFPRTVSDEWHITFRFSQPLRISEISLAQENAVKTNTSILRFLAQPETTYRIYFDPDRQVILNAGEPGNLAQDKDIVRLAKVPTNLNPDYKIADIDNDGVPDIGDNCVSAENSDQTDANNNGKGDACDDFDKDGLINSLDNCLNLPNRDQKDTDGDRLGDACDNEESRITEKNPWLPWVGIGFAGAVLIILFAFTAMAPKKTVD